MSLLADVQTRLVAALGPDIPVLLPEQVREPLEAAPLDKQGRPMVGGGERGLGVYLARHPQGYVQLHGGGGLISNGFRDTGLMQVDCWAIDRATAEALQLRVRQAIGSLQVSPTPFTCYIPPQTIYESGVIRIQTTYQTQNFGL